MIRVRGNAKPVFSERGLIAFVLTLSPHRRRAVPAIRPRSDAPGRPKRLL